MNAQMHIVTNVITLFSRKFSIRKTNHQIWKKLFCCLPVLSKVLINYVFSPTLMFRNFLVEFPFYTAWFFLNHIIISQLFHVQYEDNFFSLRFIKLLKRLFACLEFSQNTCSYIVFNCSDCINHYTLIINFVKGNYTRRN